MVHTVILIRLTEFMINSRRRIFLFGSDRPKSRLLLRAAPTPQHESHNNVS